MKHVSVLGKAQIVIGAGIANKYVIEEIERLFSKETRIVIITDGNVLRLHGETLLSQFSSFDQAPLVLSVHPGEISKCYETKQKLEREMLQAQCSRNTLVIAFGGGVIGDLAGFVAATYMRGIPFIQLPTTLLAMVDSSIGGKTGIDTPEGKNLIGAFWQPLRVFIDPNFLETLPIRELSNGLAECIKMFAIGDQDMFSELENEEINFQKEEYKGLLEKVITRSAEMKADIVTRDEREGGLRSLLNFGHTIGHAIEGLLSDVLLHGECVSIGMIKEAEIARALGHLSAADVARLKKCCQNHGLPVAMPPRLSVDDLMEKMAIDKKNTASGNKRCVLLSAIGKTVEAQATTVSDELIRLFLSRSVSVQPPGSAITGTIRVPGSKSISNRALLLAALGAGTCRITGLLHSDDTKVMMNAITTLGIASFSWENNGDTLVVHGGGGRRIRRDAVKDEASCESLDPVEVYLGNAGTASRFLTTVCTMIDAGDGCMAQTLIKGNSRMHIRPVRDLVNALRGNGCKLTYQARDGCLPLLIDGTGLPGGEITLDATISSQYVSSVLMCSPYAHEEITLHIAKGKAISQSYIDMTVSLMQQFGIAVTKNAPDDKTLFYRIPRGVYQNPERLIIEADASSATYPLAIAAITGGSVTVDGIGSSSLQGDADFCRLLEKMGCTVVQNDLQTTVTGPEGSLHGIDVDMEHLTDAFMTAAVVAAVCFDEKHRVTRITGIANQRVKECNRIAAMVEELGKCNIIANELPDGIEIHGRPIHEIHGAVIDCRDDHRIAMSFGVLGCVVPGIIIDDKDCVSKTYAEFWEDLFREFHLRFDTTGATTDVAQAPKDGNEHPLVIVIGMRGAGKTTQAKNAAHYLGLEFVDLDEKFEEQFKRPIKDFIEKEGWEQFRTQEYNIFQSMLQQVERWQQNAQYNGAVISCGGGIVETLSCRLLLQSQDLVIHFKRSIDEILEYLQTEQERPSYTEEIRAVWERRAPWYQETSKFEFVCPERNGKTLWMDVGKEFTAFVERLLSGVYLHRVDETVPAPLPRRVRRTIPSYFVCLTYPDVNEASKDIQQVTEGVNVIELRVDQLKSHTVDFISSQLASLRCYTNLPIIFTIRTVSQGGKFVFDEKTIWMLYEQAIRMGVEFVDVEQQWPQSLKNKIIQLLENLKIQGVRTSRLIVSEHCYDVDITANRILHLMRLCEERGIADIVKVVIRANSIDETLMLRSVVSEYTSMSSKPLIALATTQHGQLSRILNTFLCPVTHPLLPVAAAPGQLTVREINHARKLIGLSAFPTLPNGLYLFGSSIAASPSPAMHNAGFEYLHIPLTYELFPCEDVSEIVTCLQSVTTKGGNITMPHKRSIVPYLQSITNAAKIIGAVNTITRLDSGELHGDNTDWLGIANPIFRACQQKGSQLQRAMVLGAGGTARAAVYALRYGLGVKNIVIWNPRTAENAETLATYFGVSSVTSLEEVKDSVFDVVISTLPPLGVTEGVEHAISPFLSAKPVILDVVYFPKNTRILQLGKEAGCVTIDGSSMLLEQGLFGFEQWTGIRAPYHIMHKAIQQHQSSYRQEN